jgi:hypothetical protein
MVPGVWLFDEDIWERHESVCQKKSTEANEQTKLKSLFA